MTDTTAATIDLRAERAPIKPSLSPESKSTRIVTVNKWHYDDDDDDNVDDDVDDYGDDNDDDDE